MAPDAGPRRPFVLARRMARLTLLLRVDAKEREDLIVIE
jgi:hypothetical protein